MKKHPNRLWLAAFVLGWFSDLLFWKQAPGISFAIYVALILAAGYFLLRQEDVLPARNTWYVVGTIAFFAVFTFIRNEPLTVFLAYSGTLFLMMLLSVTYQGGQWPFYGIADYITRYLHLVTSAMAGAVVYWSDVQQARRAQQSGEGSPEPKKPSQFWPVLRGLAIALPVVAVFASLLSSADMVFAQRLSELMKLIKLDNLPEYIFRLMCISLVAYILVGIFVHVARHTQSEKLLGLDKPLIPPFLGFTEATVVLGAVALLFGAFVFIQFQYFFGGRTNIGFEGFTYSEYARRGFGELVTVAFFSLLMLLGLGTVVQRENERQHHVFSGLSIFIVALVGIMLVSAYQRLVMYELAYGFTRLRTYTHVFMIWLGLLLAATAVLDLLRRWRSFALAALIASLGFAASLMLMNVDGFIVSQNIQRYNEDGDLDVGYLASLSTDAIPTLVSYYQDPKLDRRARERVGAALACHQFDQKDAGKTASWQSFHWSVYQAGLLNDLDLDGYEVDDERDVTVETPSGQDYPCYSYIMD